MKIEFWFEFASTYSYLSVMRLPRLAQERGIEVVWRPFLLGPIFAAQGLTDSPFNIYKVKGQYMWRDMQRRCGALGLPLQKPKPFPQNGLKAARIATAALPHPNGVAFCQNVFCAEFGEAKDISVPDVLVRCAEQAGLEADILHQAQSDTTKVKLRETTAEAERKGIFGAPSFTVGDEVFWGDDRLDVALDWAASNG